MKKLTPDKLFRMANQPIRGEQVYEETIMETIKALVRKWPDPDKLTPAKRKLITKLFRYASFASFGQR